MKEFVRQKQAEFICVRPLWRARLFFFAWGWSWSFFMSNRADAEFVLGEECWIERNLAPISQRITTFQAYAGSASSSIKSLEICLGRDAKAIGQAHFNFLGEEMIGRAMAKDVALVDFAKVKRPWRQDIRVG